MGATAATPRGQVPNETEVRREIEHVLSSSVFRGSKRCHDFTNYVCAKTLQGASGTLKERTIAIDVFGRRTNEAVGDDNIVRVGAREVRKRLALYYAGEGAEDPVRIELPTGTYVPVFRYQSEKSNFAVHRTQSKMFRQSLRRTPGATTGPGSGSSQGQLQPLAVSVLWLRPAHFSPSGFDNFWQPAFDTPAPILLVMPHPIVYHPSSRALLLDEQLNGKPDLPTARPINIPARRLDGSDFVPVITNTSGLATR